MPATEIVQARVDPEVKERAADVLSAWGLTISDAVRILLARTAHEGALPLELLIDSEAHQDWFRRKVEEAFADQRPNLSHDEVRAHFRAKRAAAREKSL